MYHNTQSSFLASLRFLSFSLLLMALSTSCEKEQYQPEQEEEQAPYQEPPCELGQCLNGSVCLDGTCDCPDGFTGKFCEFRTGSFTDSRDNRAYKWVTLRDGKKWMAENLIIEQQAPFAYFYEHNPGYRHYFGPLYTWGSLMQGNTSSNANPSGVKGLCPDGWHLPSSDEWTSMADLYGGLFEEAGNDGQAAYFALIDEGYSGLNLRLGGALVLNGSGYGPFLGLYVRGQYWSSTNDGQSITDKETHSFLLKEGSIRSSKNTRSSAFSCRCIED